MTGSTGRRDWIWVALAMLLGFGLRVIHVLQMQDNPHHLDPIMDSLYHVEWARALAAGEEFEPLADRPFFRAPLYVWFLAGSFFVFGDGLLWPRLIQCAFGAATVGLAYGIGRDAFDPRVGRLASLVTATYWVLVYFDGELLIPTLAVPLNLLALWLLIGAENDPGPKRSLGAGIALGLSAIARPNVLLFAGFIAPWLVLRERPRWLRGLVAATLFAAGLLAPILPITAYNTWVKKDFVLISSQGGVNFWIGNNPYSNGVDAIVPGTRAGWWDGYYDSIAQAERLEGRPLRASEVSRHYASRAFGFIVEEPTVSIPLLAEKLRLFWTDWEYGNNEDIRFFVTRFSAAHHLSISFALLGALGLLGVVVSLRDASRLFPLWGFLGTYMLSVVAFFVCSRFRVPVLPVLAVFGAHAVFWLLDRARDRRWGRVAAALAASLAFGIWSAQQAPERGDESSAGLVQLALAESRRGDEEQAIAHLRRAVAIQPDDAFALTKLGMAEQRLGNSSEAIRNYRRAVRIRPLAIEPLDAWLGILAEQGRAEQAETVAKDYIRMLARRGIDDPPEAVLFHLGRAAWAQGDLARARRIWSRTLASDPRSLRALLALARLDVDAERWQDAEKRYRKATQQRPRDTPRLEDRAFRGLIEALSRQGRGAEACREAERWAGRRPAGGRARETLQRACAPDATRPPD